MTDWFSRMVPLKEQDGPAMYALMQEMFEHLPDPRWYYGSTQEELEEQARMGFATGIWEGERLVAMNFLVPAHLADHGGYAAQLGHDSTNSLNYDGIVVAPDYKRRGIQSAFLERARKLGYKTIYATVDPENVPSLASFEKAGYVRVAQENIFDGRPRVFMKLDVE